MEVVGWRWWEVWGWRRWEVGMEEVGGVGDGGGGRWGIEACGRGGRDGVGGDVKGGGRWGER